MSKIQKIPNPNLDNRSDEELMRLFIDSKKQELFGVIYQRHFVSLSKYLNWLIGDIEQAKDIAQNIFMKIHDNPSLFKPTGNFKVWLFTIAKNQWKNALRNNTLRKTRHREFSNSIGQESNENALDDVNGKKLRLNKAMNELSDDHKEIIVLKYSNNLSLNEIAGVLKCSEGTVKSRLFYALDNLKDLIKKK